MLYQKILTGETPYHVRVCDLDAFGEHRHADMEFNYCISGDFDIIIDKNLYHIKAGEIAVISPMVSHGIPQSEYRGKRVLTVTLGASFLKKHFTRFSKNQFPSPVCVLSDLSEAHKKLRLLLEESAELCDAQGENAELMLEGNLYKICAYLINQFSTEGAGEQNDTDLRMVENIEKALELIYYHYAEPLTVEDAAIATGYGKSNFCKIFKLIAGDTFHNLLNRQRVENACGFLSETAMPISEIAQEVGFADAKTFCRVFKTILGITPGEYRRRSVGKNEINAKS